MLDVHPPHEAAHSWKDFFIHIATIVIGLLIAVGLEQTVEAIHHRHQAAEARTNIQEELSNNIKVYKSNLQHLAEGKQQLESSLDALNSKASNAEILTHLRYAWTLGREQDAAWQGAKIDGSLALIPPAQLASASYLYGSTNESTPTIFAYFTEVDTAAVIVDHARATGALTASERQQLITRTISAMGYIKVLSRLYEYRAKNAEKVHLE